ncbi:hypothetical protein EHI8A_129760 [Entamoeba histolytica HM-1:IMSS-B]|uniref:UBX domain-containing protein n=6 Tax=Entamoeba histolytica TaxID=5759 RepID=B1N4I2_ENTH1|nr:hypothetical protein, conserved [Entamoeba histolytica HM-1:IMSS]EMD43017.1 Hypothetical protein EHI5A_158320 [Entamoeba histolytica KU27]EMH77358.1 hypothetical protein EHI8A_129760 [Entamoeba histolytica HM-1:IMSS-B]EMS11858.1 hypothetical protein KM1_205600 [Entamoeba histolytica HM-3:IMSS]ENY64219.1 hypothetical protein EHI7A_119690 [Entamoeba histolytica HM-1:IMSS-A]GAT98425.1 hypothetical protein conserved [Entamoeba histolytica]|eukprot:XP_001914098.1 hypothetical protein, conserved [Entamoeba histolytica HM-1:IMSS]
MIRLKQKMWSNSSLTTIINDIKATNKIITFVVVQNINQSQAFIQSFETNLAPFLIQQGSYIMLFEECDERLALLNLFLPEPVLSTSIIILNKFGVVLFQKDEAIDSSCIASTVLQLNSQINTSKNLPTQQIIREEEEKVEKEEEDSTIQKDKKTNEENKESLKEVTSVNEILRKLPPNHKQNMALFEIRKKRLNAEQQQIEKRRKEEQERCLKEQKEEEKKRKEEQENKEKAICEMNEIKKLKAIQNLETEERMKELQKIKTQKQMENITNFYNGIIKIKFRCPNGKSVIHEFYPTDSIQDIYEYVRSINYSKAFTITDMKGNNLPETNLSLKQTGINGSVILNINNQM